MLLQQFLGYLSKKLSRYNLVPLFLYCLDQVVYRMYLFNLSKQIFHEMWQQKLRSLLALFGIVWGTVTVVLLLALGDGFETASRRDVMQVVDGAFFMIPRETTKSYLGLPKGQAIKISAAMISELKKESSDIEFVSAMWANKTNASYQGKQTAIDLYGVGEDFNHIRKIYLLPGGRFISPLDLKNNGRVAILGYKLKQKLFKNKNAEGEKIAIKNIPFLIIGVMESAEKQPHNYYDNGVIISERSYLTLFGNPAVNFILLKPLAKADPDQVEKEVRVFFSHKLHVDPTDEDAIRMFNTSKMFQFFYWFFLGIKLFLGICGALTLGVGSLGVANIMFLIVTERTHEIGIRMAIGASRRNILLQILLEALLIVSLGGALGFVFSEIMLEIIKAISLPEWMGTPALSSQVAIVTVFILACFGILSGYFPARRASRLDPVEALGFR